MTDLGLHTPAVSTLSHGIQKVEKNQHTVRGRDELLTMHHVLANHHRVAKKNTSSAGLSREAAGSPLSIHARQD
jgi:hypothetical protein